MADLLETQLAMTQQSVQLQRMDSEIQSITQQFDRMNELITKSRDLTRDEVGEMKSFRDEVKQVAQEYQNMFKGRFDPKGSDLSVVSTALEDMVKGAKTHITELDDRIKGVREEMGKLGDEMQKTLGRMSHFEQQKEALLQPKQQEAATAREQQTRAGVRLGEAKETEGQAFQKAVQAQEKLEKGKARLQTLREATTGRMSKEKAETLRGVLKTDERNITKLRKLGKEAMPELEEKVAKREIKSSEASEEHRQSQINVQAARQEYDVLRKNAEQKKNDFEVTKKQSKEFDKQVLQAKLQLKNQEKMKAVGSERLKQLNDEKRGTGEVEKKAGESLKKAELVLKKGRERFAPDRDDDLRPGRPRPRGRGHRFGLLEAASDLNLPMVSTAATVAKYAGRGMEAGADLPGGGAASGIAGMAMKGMGLLRGTAVGAGIAAGGYTALKGYQLKQMAPGFAEQRVRASGILGGVGQAREAQAAGRGLGFGPMENLADVQAGARAVGGKAAVGQLGQVSRMARATGLERGEIFQQAGAMTRAGGATGAESVNQLKKVMAEGIKAGMDKARITEFTQEVIGIQSEILKTTGLNNADAIGKTIGALLRASGDKKESFLGGPAMAGLRGMDAAMKGAARGSGGIQTGFMMRALGFGSQQKEGGKGQLVEEYQRTRQQMERGVFGGKSPEDNVKRMRSVFAQGEKEFGKGASGELALGDLLGLTQDQVQATKELLARVGEGPVSGEDAKALKELETATKDPMLQLLDVTKEEQRIMTGGIDRLSEALIEIQNIENRLTDAAISGLDNLASLFGYGTQTQSEGLTNLLEAIKPLAVGIMALTGAKGAIGAVSAAKATSAAGTAAEGASAAAKGTEAGAKGASAAAKGAEAATKGGGIPSKGAAVVGKIAKGAKILGKFAAPVSAVLNAIDATKLATMSPEARRKYLENKVQELSQKGTLGLMWEGLTSPIDTTAALIQEISDIVEMKSPEGKTESLDFNRGGEKLKTPPGKQQTTPMPTPTSPPLTGITPPAPQMSMARTPKPLDLQLPKAGGGRDNMELTSAIKQNTKALEQYTSVLRSRIITQPLGTMR